MDPTVQRHPREEKNKEERKEENGGFSWNRLLERLRHCCFCRGGRIGTQRLKYVHCDMRHIEYVCKCVWETDREGVKRGCVKLGFWGLGGIDWPYVDYLHPSSDIPVTLLGLWLIARVNWACDTLPPFFSTYPSQKKNTKQKAEETNAAFIWAGRPRCSYSGAGGLSDWPTALNSI